MQATNTFLIPIAGEIKTDMGRTPVKKTWKDHVSEWGQVIAISAVLITALLRVEHRLTAIEITGMMQAQAQGRAVEYSSLAVESVIRWIEIQRDATPIKSSLHKQAEEFIKEIREKQKKISKNDQGGVAGSDRN